MVTPAHDLLTWSGVYGSAVAPVEEWSFSLKRPVIPFSNEQRVEAATAMRASFDVHLKALFRPSTVLTRCRYVQMTGTGEYATYEDGAYRLGDNVSPVAGTTATGTVYPLQTAVCVSLVTARPGPTGKGRFYMPAPYYAVADSDFRLSTSNRDTIAAAAAAFVGSVKGYLGGTVVGDDSVQVVSSKGYMTPVTGVRVGRVLDTQRSRRGDLLEEYATVAVP